MRPFHRMFFRHAVRAAVAITVSRLHAGDPAQVAVAEPAPSVFSGAAGITVSNQYMTRGFVVQDEGVSFQPYLSLTATCFRSDGFVSAAATSIDMWSAIGSSPINDAVGGDRFTEFDYGLSGSVVFAERLKVALIYNRWTSPAGAYDDGHWISVRMEFDDTGLIVGHFALTPFFQVTHDFNEAIPGECFEAGIRPGYRFFAESDTPFMASLVIKAGFGSGYFAEDFGYWATGPQLFVPLGFIEPEYGRWGVSAECLHYRYGKLATEANGRDHGIQFGTGLHVEF